MQIFSRLYNKVLQWSRHDHAPYYLSGVSIIESSIFPIPPDVMLISMTLAKPEKAWFYAGITTISSVIGGMLGYVIGAFFLQLIYPYIVQFGYEPSFMQVKELFHQWGFWIIFLAGFTPIPYKVFTISAGATRIAFLPFVFASLLGRALRFFLVAAAILWAGESLQKGIPRWIDLVGWISIVAIIGFIVWRMFL